MRILIGTPAFGGLVTTQYLQSLIPAVSLLSSQGHQVEIHMQANESLISRGRNTCAMYAIKNGFDKLLFIDADMIFTAESVDLLVRSKKKVVGGTYPLKAHPITLNFNPLPHQRDLFGEHRQQDNYIEWVAKYADSTGEAEVMHIPTGFMLIDMEVFAKLSYVVPWYNTFHPEHKTTEQAFDFFPVRVVEHEYESEDWSFCSLAREAGFPIYLQTRAVNGHTGTMHYGLGQHIVVGETPLIEALAKARKS